MSSRSLGNPKWESTRRRHRHISSPHAPHRSPRVRLITLAAPRALTLRSRVILLMHIVTSCQRCASCDILSVHSPGLRSALHNDGNTREQCLPGGPPPVVLRESDHDTHAAANCSQHLCIVVSNFPVNAAQVINIQQGISLGLQAAQPSMTGLTAVTISSSAGVSTVLERGKFVEDQVSIVMTLTHTLHIITLCHVAGMAIPPVNHNTMGICWGHSGMEASGVQKRSKLSSVGQLCAAPDPTKAEGIDDLKSPRNIAHFHLNNLYLQDLVGSSHLHVVQVALLCPANGQARTAFDIYLDMLGITVHHRTSIVGGLAATIPLAHGETRLGGALALAGVHNPNLITNQATGETYHAFRYNQATLEHVHKLQELHQEKESSHSSRAKKAAKKSSGPANSSGLSNCPSHAAIAGDHRLILVGAGSETLESGKELGNLCPVGVAFGATTPGGCGIGIRPFCLAPRPWAEPSHGETPEETERKTASALRDFTVEVSNKDWGLKLPVGASSSVRVLASSSDSCLARHRDISDVQAQVLFRHFRDPNDVLTTAASHVFRHSNGELGWYRDVSQDPVRAGTGHVVTRKFTASGYLTYAVQRPFDAPDESEEMIV